MTAEQWQRIEPLFHSALEREAEERAAFLCQTCDGDSELRSQVEALLASFDEAGDFIERPLLSLPGDSLSSAATEISRTESIIGRQVGNYEILSLLGAGGMGEVYLARDVRLDRQVALKLLPAQFTRDPAQVRRFEREARAVSALNHPNIIVIYEIGQEAETHFIAMEFVPGRTLREVIATQKPALGEALNIAAQIASALAAAHAAGIVHRDIKPENVMARPDGLVKVLDFGLAKPVAAETTGKLRKPETVSLQTDPKMLMGTLTYLSPEQARGENVDHRSDIFSLGILLYEMVSGMRPFDGQNAMAILDAIVRQPLAPVEITDPAFSTLRDPLNVIISKALAKDRAARYRSAAEMQADLRALLQTLEATTTSHFENTSSPWWRHGWKGKTALAAAALAALAVVWLFWPHVGSGPDAPALVVKGARRLTDQAGYKLFPSLAPDGQSVVYASRTGTNWDIYLQQVGAREAINLTADSPHVDLHPTFAPDGKRIAFYSSRAGGSGIFLMDADGANVTQITTEGFNPAWSPDGREIAFTTDRIFDYEGRSRNSQLLAVNVSTRARRAITEHDAVQPNWSPSGARIAFWGTHKGGQRDIWTVAVKGGEPVAVTDDEFVDWNPVWARDGRHLYFLSNRGGGMNLWRVPIDEKSGEVNGAPEQPLTLPSASSQHLSFSGDGRSLVYVELNRREDLWQLAFDPVAGKINGAPVRITQGARRHSYPELSPDGRLILFTTLGETQEDLFVVNPDGTGARQLTNDTFRNRASHWSPDGQQIAFTSDRTGKYEIWLVNRDGSGLRQLTDVPGEGANTHVWSPDGLRLIYQAGGKAYTIEPGKPSGNQSPQLLPGELPNNFSSWSWSPDGNILAGWQIRPERQDGGVVLYSFVEQRYERLTDRGRQPIWLNDNRRLLFIELGQLYLLDRATGRWPVIHSVQPDNIGGCTLSRDNHTLYYSQTRNETDLWLMALR